MNVEQVAPYLREDEGRDGMAVRSEPGSARVLISRVFDRVGTSVALVILFGIGPALPLPAGSLQDPRFDPRPRVPWKGAADETLAGRLVARWAERQGVAAPSAAVRAVAASLGNFRSIFCYPGNSPETVGACEALLRSPERLQAPTTAYLNDALLTKRPQVVSMFSRLAEAIDLRAEDGGYQREEPNALQGTALVRMAGQQTSSPEIQAGARWYCLQDSRVTVQEKPVYARGRGDEIRELTPAASDVVLEVRLVDTDDLCGADCRPVLRRSVAEAFSLWRRAWPAFGWILVVDGTTYAEEWLVQAVRGGGDDSRRLMTILRRARNARAFNALGTTPLSRDPVRPVYLELAQADATLLCRGLPATGEPWVLSLRAAACGVRREPREAKEVILVRGDTKCGPRDSIIACAEVEGDVELSAGGFRFTAGATPAAVLGTTGEKVDLVQVLLHEVGHWFGAQHSEGPAGADGRTNVLDGTYNVRGQCVREENLIMIERAADRTWELRATGCQGLRYPGHPR